MPLTPFPIQQFGGLNLQDDPTEIGVEAATDLLNVTLDTRGRLQSRPGYTNVTTLTSKAAVNRGLFPFNDTSSGNMGFIVADTGPHLNAYNQTGTFLAAAVPGAAGMTGVTSYGTTTSPYVFVANGTDTIWRYDIGATSWSQPAGMPAGRYLATTRSSRLVAANIGGTVSRVSFSNPGAPTTFSGNTIDLAPGDGAEINGLVAWQDEVIAFKENRFFVFYGESTLSDGSPVFNNRRIEGFGCRPGACCVGREGVYFWDGKSIWVTQGGTPTRVSDPIDPWLRLIGSGSQLGIGQLYGDTSNVSLYYANDHLYVTVYIVGTGAQPAATFVLTPQIGQWVLWDTAMHGVGSLDPGSFEIETYWLAQNGTAIQVRKMGGTTDAGGGISWRYQTGYSSAGGYFRARIISSGERKLHHHVDILGTGSATHQVLTLNPRPSDVADSGASVTLGTDPTPGRGYRRVGARGTHFAHKLSGTAAASINGLTYWLAGIETDT